MSVQVIQHTSAEYLGLIEDHLEGRSIRFHYCRPFTGKVALPKIGAIEQGLVLLGGGPWGSAGARDLPALAQEVALTKACLDRQLPVVGIGLGAQILALAAGGKTEESPFEFSVGKAKRTAEGALSGYLPAEYPIAIYMRDWPLPPPGAEILAKDQKGRVVLWQLGKSLGFAGHPGLKLAMVEDLVMEFEEAPHDVASGLAELRAAQRPIEDALVPIMTGVVRLAGWQPIKIL